MIFALIDPLLSLCHVFGSCFSQDVALAVATVSLDIVRPSCWATNIPRCSCMMDCMNSCLMKDGPKGWAPCSRKSNMQSQCWCLKGWALRGSDNEAEEHRNARTKLGESIFKLILLWKTNFGEHHDLSLRSTEAPRQTIHLTHAGGHLT